MASCLHIQKEHNWSRERDSVAIWRSKIFCSTSLLASQHGDIDGTVQKRENACTKLLVIFTGRRGDLSLEWMSEPIIEICIMT